MAFMLIYTTVNLRSPHQQAKNVALHETAKYKGGFIVGRGKGQISLLSIFFIFRIKHCRFFICRL